MFLCTCDYPCRYRPYIGITNLMPKETLCNMTWHASKEKGKMRVCKKVQEGRLNAANIDPKSYAFQRWKKENVGWVIIHWLSVWQDNQVSGRNKPSTWGLCLASRTREWALDRSRCSWWYRHWVGRGFHSSESTTSALLSRPSGWHHRRRNQVDLVGIHQYLTYFAC